MSNFRLLSGLQKMALGAAQAAAYKAGAPPVRRHKAHGCTPCAANARVAAARAATAGLGFGKGRK